MTITMECCGCHRMLPFLCFEPYGWVCLVCLYGHLPQEPGATKP
jgi:hypothetical protein